MLGTCSPGVQEIQHSALHNAPGLLFALSDPSHHRQGNQPMDQTPDHIYSKMAMEKVHPAEPRQFAPSLGMGHLEKDS